jgi:nucleoside-diphosphate-sugar epimerase
MKQKREVFLLLGGTGVIGKELTKLIQKENRLCVVTTRSNNFSTNPNLIFETGNAKNLQFLQELNMKYKIDKIVDFMNYRTDEFSKNYSYLSTICNHYIFISSCRVFRDTQKKKIDEQTDHLLNRLIDKQYLATDEYALSKSRQELIIKNSEFKNWTIARPYLTYGDGRLQLGPFEKPIIENRLVSNREILFPIEMVKIKTTLTHSKDVADLIFSLFGKENSFMNSYNLTSNQSITWEEVIDVYKKHLKLKFKIVTLDKFMSLPVDYDVMTRDRLYNRIFDNSKILDLAKKHNKVFINFETGLKIESYEASEKKLADRYTQILSGKMDKLLGEKPLVPFKPLELNTFYYFVGYHSFLFELRGYVTVINRFLRNG